MRSAQALDGALTTEGTLIGEIEARIWEEKQKKLRAEKEVEDLVRNAAYSGYLERIDFVIINMNYLCKTLQNNYWPCEIGMVAFNLEKGLFKGLHDFIDSGGVPLGYARQAQALSETTHNIPYDNFSLGDRNYTRIIKDVSKFISTNDDQIKRIFCLESEMEKIENMLMEMSKHVRDKFKFQLLNVSKLFFELQNLTALAGAKIPSPQTAEFLLERDDFQFTLSEIGCQFHNAMASHRFCSLSKVARLAYTILDFCSKVERVELSEPGAFLPEEVQTPPLWKRSMPKFAAEVLEVGLEEAIIKEEFSLLGSLTCRKSGIKAGITLLPANKDPRNIIRKAIDDNGNNVYFFEYFCAEIDVL